MGKYIVQEAEEYFDWDDPDSHGNPTKKIRYTGKEYETCSEPENSIGLSVMSDGYTEKHTVIKGSSRANDDDYFNNYRKRGAEALKEYGNMPFTIVKELDGDCLVVETIMQYSMGVVKKDSNKVVVPLAFGNITKFGDNGLIKASLFKDYIFDRSGRELTCYDRIYELKNGVAKVERKVFGSGGFGYINDKAKQIIPPRYSKITDFNEDGFAYAKLRIFDSKEIKFDKTGKRYD